MFAQMFPYFAAGMLLGEKRRAEPGVSMVPLLATAAILAAGGFALYSPVAMTVADGSVLWRTPGLVLVALLTRGGVSLLVAALLVWIYRTARSQALEKVSRDYGTATLQIYLAQGLVFEVLSLPWLGGFWPTPPTDSEWLSVRWHRLCWWWLCGL
jgi:fucose 4-O-acetylase-like acetyltransferase